MIKKVLLALLIILILLSFMVVLYVQQPQFGSLPKGGYLEKIQKSPNYSEGQFQNLVSTTVVVNENNSISTFLKFLFSKKEQQIPSAPIPGIKTDLMALDPTEDIVVWLGHSSYYLQLGGKRILIDPVFSSYASPVFFVNKAFAGSNQYKPEDMPEIDYLLISHDHWDHLDYPTIMALKPKIKQIVCPLGVGAYFDQWGFKEAQIYEGDWFTKIEFENDFVIHVLPARHFSGRLLTRNKTLWAGFALITPQHRVYYSGDGGYGPHFREIGEMFGGFDLAIMENGQYDLGWPYIHMMPEEVAKAAEELKAKAILPGHAGKFAMANHAWNDPYKRIVQASQDRNYRLLTPIIGEPVELKNQEQYFGFWWENIK
ncbi:MAG: MBL fold metallo-hydrolase [Pelosinus sp.]|nr:MBL fold metallo-hydrolase [Pelosinus sp.]